MPINWFPTAVRNKILSISLQFCIRQRVDLLCPTLLMKHTSASASREYIFAHFPLGVAAAAAAAAATNENKSRKKIFH